MKQFILALATLLTITVSASAMSYEQARDQALFLTDKMAYELNLTDEQYEAAYEINLDYLMRVDTRNDLYGVYWRQRNLDLGYILLDWQYRAYTAASYFYRPLYWDSGYWHFGIYARYPRRNFFYFGCPNFVITYNGGHSWHRNGGRSWYNGRRWEGPRDGGARLGMRSRFDNGHFGQGFRYEPSKRTWTGGPQNRNTKPGLNNRNNGSIGNRTFGNLNRGTKNDSPLRNRTFGTQANQDKQPTNGRRSFGTPRQSSTRATVSQPSNNNSRSFGSRFTSSPDSKPSRTFMPNNSNRSLGNHGSSSSSSTRSFGSKSTTRQSPPSRSSSSSKGSFGSRSNNSGNNTGGGGGHFGRR